MTDLTHFRTAQEGTYAQALAEISAGRKRSHWMWYVFPQLRGLGRSQMADRYGLADLDETRAYLADPVLGPRLREISEALLEQPERDAYAVFGTPDDLKLHASMTLFARVDPASSSVFRRVLDAFFDGEEHERTLALLATA